MTRKAKAASPEQAGNRGKAASSKQFQPNAFPQNPQASICRMIKRVVIRLVLWGLVPIAAAKLIAGRWRHD